MTITLAFLCSLSEVFLFHLGSRSLLLLRLLQAQAVYSAEQFFCFEPRTSEEWSTVWTCQSNCQWSALSSTPLVRKQDRTSRRLSLATSINIQLFTTLVIVIDYVVFLQSISFAMRGCFNLMVVSLAALLLDGSVKP